MLHLYRPRQQGIENPAIEIFVDESTVALLTPETFTSIEVAPGRHRVMGRIDSMLGEHWLPPEAFDASPGGTYFIYPIARTAKGDPFAWKPLALAMGVAVISGGTFFLLSPGHPADVTLGHYWQLADENTPDAYVDRMRQAQFVKPHSSP